MSTAEAIHSYLKPIEHGELTPLPRQIDEMVEHFEELRDQAELADDAYEDCKLALIDLVRRFGAVPTGAESSIRLQGWLTTITVTVGSTIAIKEDAVGELKGAMEANRQGALFAQLFTERTRHELQKDAANQLRIAQLPQRLAKKFTELYARCFDVKKKSPSLKVERLADKPAKKSRAKKAVA